jgi:hypothetical protein
VLQHRARADQEELQGFRLKEERWYGNKKVKSTEECWICENEERVTRELIKESIQTE